MYNLSKSVPRGYEYLSSRYSKTKPHKADVVQDYPPAPYLHQHKSYLNASPLRNKKMLVEARTFRSPFSEKVKTLNLPKHKLENVFQNLKSLSSKFKSNQKLMKKQFKENLKKFVSLDKETLN